MIDLTKALETALEHTGPLKMVDDATVEKCILNMAEKYQYRPSEQIIEPIRAFLSGYGIILSGDAGLGKTFLMKCLGVRMYAVNGIAEYGLRSIANWYEWTDGNDLCIDDLGAEAVTAEFGAKDDVLKIAIAHRSERQSGRTSITTNLSSEEIVERYGDRTLSRILGMCKPFHFDGANMRSPVQGITERITG